MQTSFKIKNIKYCGVIYLGFLFCCITQACHFKSGVQTSPVYVGIVIRLDWIDTLVILEGNSKGEGPSSF